MTILEVALQLVKLGISNNESQAPRTSQHEKKLVTIAYNIFRLVTWRKIHMNETIQNLYSEFQKRETQKNL